MQEAATNFCREQLSILFKDNEHEKLAQLSRSKDPGFKGVQPDGFALEYLACKLALAARIWEENLKRAGIDEEKATKLFFRSTMQCFQSPKMKPLAESFSDYLYNLNPGPEEPVTVASAVRMRERLGMPKPGDVKSVSTDSFEGILIPALEAFRVYFENEAQDFLLAQGKFS